MEASTTTGSRAQCGFAYMALLVVISASLLSLSAALPDKYQQAKREREAQLLFVGQQYSNAIRLYYENPLVAVKRYPESLDQLLVDDRSPEPKHHLRQLYQDPITGSPDWGLVKNAEGEIMGVYSLSKGKPLRQNFAGQAEVIVVGGEEYNDIKFVYLRN